MKQDDSDEVRYLWDTENKVLEVVDFLRDAEEKIEAAYVALDQVIRDRAFPDNIEMRELLNSLDSARDDIRTVVGSAMHKTSMFREALIQQEKP